MHFRQATQDPFEAAEGRIGQRTVLGQMQGSDLRGMQAQSHAQRKFGMRPAAHRNEHALDGREITRPNGSKFVLHTAGATVVDYTPSLRERAVLMVADPNLAFIILVLGGLLLYVEFNTPGMVARAYSSLRIACSGSGVQRGPVKDSVRLI